MKAEDQTEFNLRRWSEITGDTEFARELARIEGRIETDRHGYIIVSPPAAFRHGSYQSEIAHVLRNLLSHGRTATECPISTADGVRAADGAWISHKKLKRIGEDVCLREAPEICVEILSADNSRREMAEKRALYFAAGAEEVWFCDQGGRMAFYVGSDSAGEKASRVCPAFPSEIKLTSS